MSLDWEDWFQLCCPPFEGPEAFSRFEDRLALATDRALAFCEQLGARGTWFCLADQALRHPGLVRRIAQGGHRIGVHGRTHRRAFELGPEVYARSLGEARRILEDLSGMEVLSHRAPEWSLRGSAEGAWRLLPDLGFSIDSSRAPLRLLGNPAWPRAVHRLENGVLEFPPPVAGPRLLALPLWGWPLRLLPGSWMRARLQALATAGAGNPVVLHPWELDEGQPSLPEGIPLGHRFAHAAGLRGYAARLEGLLGGLRLIPLEVWVAEGRADRSL